MIGGRRRNTVCGCLWRWTHIGMKAQVVTYVRGRPPSRGLRAPGTGSGPTVRQNRWVVPPLNVPAAGAADRDPASPWGGHCRDPPPSPGGAQLGEAGTRIRSKSGAYADGFANSIVLAPAAS